MDANDSLQIDEHLARLLATYDQGFGGGDHTSPTLNIPELPPAVQRMLDADPPADPPPADPPPAAPPAADTGFDVTPPDPSPPLGAPHRVGRFELRRQLGKGGCGIVFLAYDPKLRREVALKIPRPELLLNGDARKRFVREARAAAEFDHPNLVPVYETGEIGPVCYIATAYCPGQTLAEWIDRQAFPVPVRQAARLAATLAEAVQHAHDRGVLHRDLKPNNVLLQEVREEHPDGEPPPGACQLRGDHFLPRVLDFGLAKLAEPTGGNETTTRQILGTPKYMAPEQAQGRHADVGPAADVYALGVILYELLTGRAPYDGATDVDVLRQAVEALYPRPRAVRGDIPRDLEAITLKAMARSPARRYATAADLADDLRRFLDGRPTLARPLGFSGRAVRWLRRNDQAVALVAVTSLAFFFLVVGTWTSYQHKILKDDKVRDRLVKEEGYRKDRQRYYAQHVREAFLSWRAGDARRMGDALAAARGLATQSVEGPCFAWGYLTQLGRIERQSVACPAGPVRAAAVGPDGRRAATGHADGTLTVWDRSAGRPLAAAAAHPGGVAAVAFVRGGRGLVTAGVGTPPRVWDVAADGTLTPAGRLGGVDLPATDLAVHAASGRVYAGFPDGRIGWWDAADPARPGRLWPDPGGDPVTGLDVSPDGATVATAGKAGPVRLWHVATGEEEDEVRGSVGAAAVAFVPAADGWMLAAARDDGTVRVFSRQAREVLTIAGHSEAILAVAASPGGGLLASAGEDATVCLWDVGTGELRGLLRSHAGPVRGVGFTPDGRELVTASEDGMMKTWDLTADPEGPTLRGLPAAVTAASAAAGRGPVTVAYADGEADLFERPGGAPRRVPAGGRGPLAVVRGRVGVELTARGATVWGLDPVRELFRATAADGAAGVSADYSPDSGLLAVGDDHGRVGVWSVPERAAAGGFDTLTGGPVRHLELGPDGQAVAAQTRSHLLGVWAVPGAGTADPYTSVPGHGDGLWVMRFLPGGFRVATAGRGSSIKVWNLNTRKEELALMGHVGRVTSLAVSPDGRTLVSGSSTGEVKLWDVRTGLELVGVRRHTGPVTVAEFAPDGRVLVTGSLAPGGRGELAVWEAARE